MYHIFEKYYHNTKTKEQMARQISSYNWEETNAELIALLDSHAVAVLHKVPQNILMDDTLQHLVDKIFQLTEDEEKVFSPNTDDERVARLWTAVQEYKECPQFQDKGCEILTDALGYLVTNAPTQRSPLKETKQAIIRLFSLTSTRNLRTSNEQMLTPWLSQFIDEVNQDMDIVAKWREGEQHMAIQAFLYSLDEHQTQEAPRYVNYSWKGSMVTLMTMWLYH